MNIEIINNIPGIQAIMNETADGNIKISIAKKSGRKLSEVALGEVVKLGEREFIVLGQSKDTTAVITKDFAKEIKFGVSGDWRESDIRKFCNGDFYDELSNAIGEENIIPHAVNLTADDGTGKGITCRDNISILTNDLYRRYRDFLPAYGHEYYTATRVTHDNPDYARDVCCVSSDGILGWVDCVDFGGVRPFCILNSSIEI